jgi:acetylornithine/succinyldiaminopimelate/putrescine aminotransferase/predicted amino acid dehydrogenase
MLGSAKFPLPINAQESTPHHPEQFPAGLKSPDEFLTVAAYQHYCRPGLVPLLQGMSLDVVYERAVGDYLWQKHGQQLIKILDLVGGYGANLFGHHHPELVAEAQRLLLCQIPVLSQGSCHAGAAKLAKALNELVGDYVTIFTNSGAETIEAAIKHAFLERQRSIFWAVKGSFHGKTLGALQLTWSEQAPLVNGALQVRHLDPYDSSSWVFISQEVSNVAAIFIEPILGEGGIQQLPQNFINWLVETSQSNDIPLVVDEIQTGMGRTGTFLASEFLGLKPDYLCLSKALGGGLAKIGALMIKRDRFIPEFSIRQTSTFAEDDMSCLIALKALEIMQRDHLPARCASVGDRLLHALESLRTRFPDQIKGVRGKGLMIGIELQDQSNSPSNALKMFSQSGYLGYMAAAYLLHVHRIRVMPTLSQPLTLRIQPSAYLGESEIERLVEALTCFCEAQKALDILHLTAFQVGQRSAAISHFPTPQSFKREKPTTVKRVAFLGHLIQAEHVALCEPSLARLGPQLLEAYLAKTSSIVGPTVLDTVNVLSQTGDEVHLSFIGFNLTSRQLEQACQTSQTKLIMDKIEAGVALAKQQGCQVVGFGGYLSIVSGNCRRIKTQEIALTTGNSLTIGMGILALQKAARQQNIELSQSCLAVVGAAGNIAATYAVMMAPYVKAIVLIVRHPNALKLEKLKREISQAAPEIAIYTTDNICALRSCSLIVAASNAVQPLIYPEHLGNHPVVICDISVPADVSSAVSIERPDVWVIQGGIVRLPCNKDFIISGIPLESGHAFACMSETLLMGLEGITSHGSYGRITPEGVNLALSMAEKHGFTLGHFNTQHLH